MCRAGRPGSGRGVAWRRLSPASPSALGSLCCSFSPRLLPFHLISIPGSTSHGEGAGGGEGARLPRVPPPWRQEPVQPPALWALPLFPLPSGPS